MTPIQRYIAEQPADRQTQLNELYKLLSDALPNAQEKIAYGMPAFYGKRSIIYFANMKHHIGLYPGAEPIAMLQKELVDYKTSKGAIQLPIDQPLPRELILKIVDLAVKRSEK